MPTSIAGPALRCLQLRRAAAVLIAGALLSAGCGSSDTESNATSASAKSTTASPSPATSGPSADQLVNQGTEAQPPTSAPPAAKGKTVWWLSCGQSIPDCSEPAAGAKEAATRLGINFRVADGRLNQGGGYVAAMRTAVAAKPDLIIIGGLSCPVIEQPLREAKAQKIPVMGVEGLDCSDPPTNGPKLFTVDMKYTTTALDGVAYFKDWGKIIGEYMVASNGGKVQYVANAHTEPTGVNLTAGFDEATKSCGGCKQLAAVKFTAADLTPNGRWTQAFKAALLRNPTTNAVMVPYDSLAVNMGGVQAVQQLAKSAKIYGGSGQGPMMDLVRDGKVAAVSAHSAQWMGWAAMDNANRALNGKETVPQGVGFRIVSKDHNLPDAPGTSYRTPIDFKAAYEKAWSSGS